MTTLDEKFRGIASENAPGQQVRHSTDQLDEIMNGGKLSGEPLDFSHGSVDAFPPAAGVLEAWTHGFESGGKQAYTEYRGAKAIRDGLAERLAVFTGAAISANEELIVTPGTQGALFLALGSVVEAQAKVAVIEPDYYANNRMVKFFGGQVVPIPLRYGESQSEHGPDLDQLEAAFKSGTKVLVFCTPNNPTGLVYSENMINTIAVLAVKYDVTVIVDQLYSRLLYSGETFTHLRACNSLPENLITVMGPSKTESLSGFRLGTAFGTAAIIDRMEKLQGIVSIRAGGYSQSVLNTWLQEPAGWIEQRIVQHEAIRDDLLKVFRDAGLATATPQAGSYLFPKLPPLSVEPETFVRLLTHQAGVTVTQGVEFGSQSRESVRLNFSQDHKAAVAAAKRIVDMVERYRA